MSIELHCTRCGKLIRAPDEAGGRRGKCPYCSESVYIPTPPDDTEEIRIAPVDEEEERRERELRREAAEYIASIEHETGSPGPAAAYEPAGVPRPPGDVVDIASEVETFVRAMRDSELGRADETVARLKGTGTSARDYVQGLILDEMPPQIEGVPPPLVRGFLKKLLEQLG